MKCVVTGGVVGGAVPPAALRCAGDEIHGDLDVTYPSLEVTMAARRDLDVLPHHDDRLLAATRSTYQLPGDADVPR